MKSRKLLGCLYCTGILLSNFFVFAQTSADSQQVFLQASHAFSGTQSITSITLTGQVSLIAGSTEETGQITLIARGDGSSNVNIDSGSLTRKETQDTFANGQTCTWSGADGTVHSGPRHNCMVPVAWFLPEVALFSPQQPATGTSTLAKEQSGQIVFRWTITPPTGVDPNVADLITHIGSYELRFDPVTNLPTSLNFAIHPDNNAGQDIPVQVLFSDYRTVDGCAIPFHVQRYRNGVLSEDITISAATVAD